MLTKQHLEIMSIIAFVFLMPYIAIVPICKMQWKHKAQPCIKAPQVSNNKGSGLKKLQVMGWRIPANLKYKNI